VREFLIEVFRNKWSGGGSQHLPGPLEWPPLRPKLSSSENALRRFIKQKIVQKRYSLTEELIETIRNAFASIAAAILRRFSLRTGRRITLCNENDGAHTDKLEQLTSISGTYLSQCSHVHVLTNNNNFMTSIGTNGAFGTICV
jgi:hypothetical protein